MSELKRNSEDISLSLPPDLTQTEIPRGSQERLYCELLAKSGPRTNAPYQRARGIRFIKSGTDARHLTFTLIQSQRSSGPFYR